MTEDRFAPDNFHAQLKALETKNFPEPEVNTLKDQHAAPEVVQHEEVHENETQVPIDLTESNNVELVEDNTSEHTQKSHMIPKSRLDKELEKRRALESQLQEERDSRIRMEAQMQMFANMQQPKEAPQQEQLDPLDPDSFNYTHRKLNDLERKLEQTMAQNQEFMRQQQYSAIATAQENAFISSNPDYMQAFEHVKSVETSIMENLLGDNRKAQEAVQRKLADMVKLSIDMGKNPAEAVYNMAKTYGYNTKKSQEARKPSVQAMRSTNASTANAGSITNSGGMNPYQRVPVNNMLNSYGEVKADVFRKELEKLERNTPKNSNY